MISADDIEKGYAQPFAPLYEPLMWLKAEWFPATCVIVIDGFFIAFTTMLWVRVLFVVVGVLAWVALQRIGEIDNRFFSIPMGFVDRIEYVATGTVTEYERENVGRKWIFF